MTKLIVRDNPGLVRDSRSKAIISEDTAAYNAYIQERNFRSQVQHVQSEIYTLKNEMTEIKNLLREFVNRNIS